MNVQEAVDAWQSQYSGQPPVGFMLRFSHESVWTRLRFVREGTPPDDNEAKLIALACSAPPKGRKRWTLTLLESAVVELNIVDRASDNTISRTLKKTRSSRISKSSGSFHQRPTPPS